MMVGYSVKQRAEYVGTFRWIAVHAMETLARWIPTTPEMELKVLFGRHVWECAQHADALGRRAFELRAPLQYSVAPQPAYVAWLAELAALESSADRVAAFYDAYVPAIARRYGAYLAATDTLMDEPTVRILERALADLERMARERNQLPESMRHAAADAQRDRRAREAAIDDVCARALPVAAPVAAA